MLKAKSVKKNPVAYYEHLWRNKWITADARSIDDMIAALQQNIEDLKKIKAAGRAVVANFDGAADDYIYFRTKDATIGKRLRFPPVTPPAGLYTLGLHPGLLPNP